MYAIDNPLTSHSQGAMSLDLIVWAGHKDNKPTINLVLTIAASDTRALELLYTCEPCFTTGTAFKDAASVTSRMIRRKYDQASSSQVPNRAGDSSSVMRLRIPAQLSDCASRERWRYKGSETAKAGNTAVVRSYHVISKQPYSASRARQAMGVVIKSTGLHLL